MPPEGDFFGTRADCATDEPAGGRPEAFLLRKVGACSSDACTMPPSNRDRALRAYQAAMAREHQAQERALASDDIDEALGAWLEALHATRRASHALRAAPDAGSEEPSTG